ncbi:MAG: tetratricopeptide repeat protein [Bacteroidota bacterium]|nr:tetratricopeptide repeat protein [Bacteroidota bacterium]
MKRLLFPSLLLFFYSANAQQTLYLNDPQSAYKQAREYFQKQNYSLAYPIFRELDQDQQNKLQGSESFERQDVHYYTLVCSLNQDDSASVAPARQFIATENNAARGQMLSYHLAEYEFRRGNYESALHLYETASIDNLSNAEIANAKFHQGYAYFVKKDFDRAKPLLDAIRQLPADPNYIDANYYYGYISFYQKKYSDASTAFSIVENSPKYRTVVPYYIANIYLIQKQKDKAIAYAASKLDAGNQYYDAELRELTGHGYYEQKNFEKALPFLESYVSKSKKVTRQDMFELSYCYYELKNYKKAIDGFKQLGGKEDSLAQNAMYLLGDSYLKTGQKANARNAFLFCASNSSYPVQKEISQFHYAKLSYELGYPDEALTGLRSFLSQYPQSTYASEARELLLSVLANTSNYRDALALMDSLTNPSENARQLHTKVLYGRATELINDGNLQNANELLDKALRERSNTAFLPYINFWKGEIAYRLNHLDEAIPYFFEYLKMPVSRGEVNPANAKYTLGYCYLKKENYREAQGFFEQVVKNPRINASPLEQDAFIRDADCYYMNRDYRTAVMMYDKVLDYSWASSDYATFQKAMVAGVSSSNEKISLLNGLIRKFPTSDLTADANMEIANTYLSNEQYRESLPFLKNVLNSSGHDALKPRAYLRSGIAYFNLENNNEALNQYNQLLKQYPNSVEAQEALDNAKSIYVEEGRSSEYVNFAKSMGISISTSQEDQLAYQEAEVQFNNGNFSAAQQKFEDYLKKFPDGKYSLEANYYKSEMYANQKNWTLAVTGYEIVADKAPNKFAERSLLQAARLNFFYIKDYGKAETYYTRLKDFASSQENKVEAMRGLLRSQYELQHWSNAVGNAQDLLSQKGIGSDDKIIANMIIGKSYLTDGKCDQALPYFKAVVSLSRATYGAEAQYQIAECQFGQDRLKEAEKSAFEVIHKSGSYELWVTKSYLLLGDIYLKEKDYFNARATFQSLAQNAKIEELRVQAEQRLGQVKEEEAKNSKISNDN